MRHITFFMKIPRESDLQKITLNHSTDVGFKDFVKLYKDTSKETFLFP